MGVGIVEITIKGRKTGIENQQIRIDLSVDKSSLLLRNS
jgi:hypothetical protein